MVSSNKKTSALKFAEYFIDKANKEGKQITNKKLQKLLYYAQVWSLVLNEEKLFPERIEAWVHGPAIPSVYRKFKNFSFNSIRIDTSDFSINLTSKQKKLLDDIWKIYGKYDASYLEALSHSELPWQEARKDVSISEPSSNIISLKIAKEYYASKLKSASK